MYAEQKTLLKKFLYGNCNDAEFLEVKALLNEPGAKEFLREWMEDQEEQVTLDYAGKEEILDKKSEEWLKKVHQRMELQAPVTSVVPMKPRKMTFLRYAAIWVGALLVTSIVLWQLRKGTGNDGQSVYVEKINVNGVPVKYLLPDSSLVYLGAGSKLSYPQHFTGDVREVKLKGEAFFQIRHMSSKPFIVLTGKVQTQVLGTSFKVQAFDSRPLTVSVATGKVSVTRIRPDQTKTLAVLTPGLRLTYNVQTEEALNSTVDISGLVDWKDGEITFDEQRLELVTAELERRFGVKIIFADEKLKDYKVSGSFSSGQSVETDMKMLSIIGKFKYQSDHNKSFLIDKPL